MLKRFMTWLLHQFQKVLSTLTGSRRRADISAPTKFGDEAAARLQQSPPSDSGDSVARRVSATDTSFPSVEAPSTEQPTAPLRPKNSSAPKGTVDPVAEGPDTHHRLDAASAAMPGGVPATPSFPSDVSELISSQSMLSPTLKDDSTNDLSVPDIKVSEDEHLPGIRDLLPAIEPENPDVLSSDELSESDDFGDGSNIAEDMPIEELTDGVAASSDQVTLFSFDITEADTSRSATDVPEDVDDSAPVESIDNVEPTDHEPDAEGVNPWLTAKPPSAQQPPEPLSKKQGTVKLLFTLKAGNFHGYIAPEDGSKDILFHQKYINAEIFDELERGSQVVATVKIIEGKAYATHVDLL